MKKALIAFLICPLFVLSACGSDTGQNHPQENTNVTNVTKIAVDGDTDNTVYEFTLSDGTHCVFVDGNQESGLACDFG